MPGSYAPNLHEGGRSEILADYLFSQWGTVSPVRGRDDPGIDLYGGLAERQGRRAVITDQYVVQVKSTSDPWKFEGKEATSWLINYPTPIFLACVRKKELSVEVYHLMPRFYAAQANQYPPRLELVPGIGDSGKFVKWVNGESFSLSAPIIRVSLSDFVNDETMNKLRDTFKRWVRLDQTNIDLLRRGLPQFRMPSRYSVNEVPELEFGEMTNTLPDDSFFQRGVRTMAESAECVGVLLLNRNDRKGALLAALLADHMRQTHGECFTGPHSEVGRVSGALQFSLLSRLYKLAPGGHYFAPLDAVQQAFDDIPLVRDFRSGPT